MVFVKALINIEIGDKNLFEYGKTFETTPFNISNLKKRCFETGLTLLKYILISSLIKEAITEDMNNINRLRKVHENISASCFNKL